MSSALENHNLKIIQASKKGEDHALIVSIEDDGLLLLSTWNNKTRQVKTIRVNGEQLLNGNWDEYVVDTMNDTYWPNELSVEKEKANNIIEKYSNAGFWLMAKGMGHHGSKIWLNFKKKFTNGS